MFSSVWPALTRRFVYMVVVRSLGDFFCVTTHRHFLPREKCFFLFIIINLKVGHMACSNSESKLLKFINLFGRLVGLLGREFSPMQGVYLHRTTQHRKTRTHTHASSGIRTHDSTVTAVEDSALDRAAIGTSFFLLS
jgi:hypothetical protein